MKKFASMSLMLVLVLVLGATAFAVEGPPSPLLKDTIPNRSNHRSLCSSVGGQRWHLLRSGR